MIIAGMSLLQPCASANITSVNNRYTLAATIVAAAVVMVFGIFFVFRSLTLLLPLRMLSTPSELRTAKVILGKELQLTFAVRMRISSMELPTPASTGHWLR